MNIKKLRDILETFLLLLRKSFW